MFSAKIYCPINWEEYKRRGMGLSSFLCDALVDFQKQHFVIRANSFCPFKGDKRGVK
jgi:hypothetical protein